MLKFRQAIFLNGEFAKWYYWSEFTRPLHISEFVSGYELKNQQYIGLHDKNGKEIYGGDIVRRGSIDKHSHEVYWHTPTACWRLTGFTGMDKSDMALMGEVVGNIYENPEMI